MKVKVILSSLLTGLLAVAPAVADYSDVPDLGTAKTYAILAATQIETNGFTDTASTTQGNDLGISESFNLRGWDDRNIVGWTNFNNDAARKAQADLTRAYLKASTLKATIIDSHLGGKTLKPGVYTSKTGLFWLTGKLTLDTQGNKYSLFIFRTSGSFKSSANSSVVIKNNKPACNVFWRVPGVATLGDHSTMFGHLMANENIVSGNGVKVYGQLLVRKGGVSLNTNYINNQVCR